MSHTAEAVSFQALLGQCSPTARSTATVLLGLEGHCVVGRNKEGRWKKKKKITIAVQAYAQKVMHKRGEHLELNICSLESESSLLSSLPECLWI